jgi:Cu(I)/Ag(I) efflux system membrane protein CusA/SilA
MNAALQIPGVSNALKMPIKARIDMLATGIRTAVGVKVRGADYREIERIGLEVERVLAPVPGTRSVFSERTGGGYFLDFVWKRDQLARYGLSIEEAQMAVANAIGGENLTTTVEGRERYPVNVRYARDFRQSRAALESVLVPVMNGRMQIPLKQLAEVRAEAGPAMYRNEDGLLTGYVFVDVDGRDIGGYVEQARRVVREKVALPPGYSLDWSGQFEAMERAGERLKVIVPITVCLIVFLLYLNTRSGIKTMIVLLAVPFSAVGAIWLLWALGYNMSIGVWVGLIALLGVDAETGVFMLLYLDLAYEKAKKEDRLRNLAELQEAIVNGAVKRIRPKFMAVATTFIGLVPILWSNGTGADVMKRIAAPVVGGVLTSFVLELLVYPAIYEVWKWNFEIKRRVSA